MVSKEWNDKASKNLLGRSPVILKAKDLKDGTLMLIATTPMATDIKIIIVGLLRMKSEALLRTEL